MLLLAEKFHLNLMWMILPWIVTTIYQWKLCIWNNNIFMPWKATGLICISFTEHKIIKSSWKYSLYKFICMSLDIHWEEKKPITDTLFRGDFNLKACVPATTGTWNLYWWFLGCYFCRFSILLALSFRECVCILIKYIYRNIFFLLFYFCVLSILRK